MKLINIGLTLLIFIIPFSPKIPLHILSRTISIRIEDVFIPLLSLIWLIYILKEKRKPIHTSLNLPIIIYFSVGIIATIMGFFFKNTVKDPLIASCEIIRNLEYYLIFFLVINNIRDLNQIKRWMRLWLLAVILVSIYGVFDHVLGISGGITGLYDKGWYWRQSNHMGGYLMISLILALFLLNKGKVENILALIAIPFISYVIIFNLSRTTYLSTLSALFVYFMLKNKRLAIVPLVIGLTLFFLIPRIFPQRHISEVLSSTLKETFSRTTKASDTYDYSPTKHRARIVRSFSNFLKYPITGLGFGAKPLRFYDSMIAYVPATMGTTGIISFIWLILRIFTQLLWRYKYTNDVYLRDFIKAFIAIFLGVLVHSLASAAFIIALIAEPFWFLIAIVMVSKQVIKY